MLASRHRYTQIAYGLDLATYLITKQPHSLAKSSAQHCARKPSPNAAPSIASRWPALTRSPYARPAFGYSDLAYMRPISVPEAGPLSLHTCALMKA